MVIRAHLNTALRIFAMSLTQFFFALGKLLGSEVTIGTMITHNLIPSTIGNTLGGAFFVGTMYSLSVGTLWASCKQLAADAFWWLREKATGRPRPPPADEAGDEECGLGRLAAQLSAAGLKLVGGGGANGRNRHAPSHCTSNGVGAAHSSKSLGAAGGMTAAVANGGGMGAKGSVPAHLSSVVVMTPRDVVAALGHTTSSHLPHVHLECASSSESGGGGGHDAGGRIGVAVATSAHTTAASSSHTSTSNGVDHHHGVGMDDHHAGVRGSSSSVPICGLLPTPAVATGLCLSAAELEAAGTAGLPYLGPGSSLERGRKQGLTAGDSGTPGAVSSIPHAPHHHLTASHHAAAAGSRIPSSRHR
jgi:hypothetical protein